MPFPMTSNFEYKVYIYNYYNYLNNSIYTVYITVITVYSSVVIIAIYLVVRYGSAFWSRFGDYLVLLLNSTALAGVTFSYCNKGRTKDKLNSFFITINLHTIAIYVTVKSTRGKWENPCYVGGIFVWLKILNYI